jgi:GATA-binding protein
MSRPSAQNAPSGIAQQLRKSSEQTAMLNNNSNPEPMNIDDFIFSDNAATPVGIPMSPQPASKSTDFQTLAGAHAIPIKSRRDQSEQQQQQQQFVPQSVPEPPHRQNVEFNYVKRHPRKTSIDERRVSLFFFSPWIVADQLSPLVFCSLCESHICACLHHHTHAPP